MSSAVEQQTVIGKITSVGCSGIGPSSGEITLVIKADDGDTAEVFAGIPSTGSDGFGTEGAVFSSYMAMALAAVATARDVQVNYLVTDKARINGIVLLP